MATSTSQDHWILDLPLAWKPTNPHLLNACPQVSHLIEKKSWCSDTIERDFSPHIASLIHSIPLSSNNRCHLGLGSNGKAKRCLQRTCSQLSFKRRLGATYGGLRSHRELSYSPGRSSMAYSLPQISLSKDTLPKPPRALSATETISYIFLDCPVPKDLYPHPRSLPVREGTYTHTLPVRLRCAVKKKLGVEYS